MVRISKFVQKSRSLLSERELKPCAFPSLSLSQSLLLFTQNQHPHIQNPPKQAFSSQKIPKEFPKNSQRVPKEFPPKSQKIPKRIPKKIQKNSQKNSQKIQEFPKIIHLAYKLPENI